MEVVNAPNLPVETGIPTPRPTHPDTQQREPEERVAKGKKTKTAEERREERQGLHLAKQTRAGSWQLHTACSGRHWIFSDECPARSKLHAVTSHLPTLMRNLHEDASGDLTHVTTASRCKHPRSRGERQVSTWRLK